MERGEVFVLPRAAYFTFPPFPQPSQPRFQVLSTCKREPWERGCLSPSGEGRQTLEASEKKCGDVFATIEIKTNRFIIKEFLLFSMKKKSLILYKPHNKYFCFSVRLLVDHVSEHFGADKSFRS